MNIEKMKEVLSDEAFFKSLFELETVVEVQAWLVRAAAGNKASIT